MYFIALTCRTNAFENQTVAADFISGFFRDLVIQKSLVWVGGVYYFFAYDAKHMIVQIGAQIVSVCTRHTNMTYCPFLTKEVQISINGATADSGILLMNIIVNLICSRVVAPCPNCVQDKVTLLCISSDHFISVLCARQPAGQEGTV